jgi:hypothetical protein
VPTLTHRLKRNYHRGFRFRAFFGRLFAFGGTPGALLQSTPKAWDLRVAPWRKQVEKGGWKNLPSLIDHIFLSWFYF